MLARLTARLLRMEPYEREDETQARRVRMEVIGEQAQDALALQECSAKLRKLLEEIRSR